MKPGPLQVDSGFNSAGSRSQQDRFFENVGNWPCSNLKMQQFFLQWLNESQDLVNSLIEDVQSGREPRLPSAAIATPLSPAHGFLSSTPPLSPSKVKSPRSPLSPIRKLPSSSSYKRSPLATIPQFFPKIVQSNDEQRTQFQNVVNEHYIEGLEGLNVRQFVDFLTQVASVPTFLSRALFRRLAGPGKDELSRETFTNFWVARGLVGAPLAKIVFDCLRGDDKQYLVYDDFKSLMHEVLHNHPGLEFLQETAEFQQKYAETVVFRIFYALNKVGNGRLTLNEVRRGDLVEALAALDQEEDINRCLLYFSYEHFYVIYCKFWELDVDHDLMIGRSDLERYGQCALSFQIVERIFEQAPRKFACGAPEKMNYEDFVWFILSEEDKTSDTALLYWFRCVDLDGDGFIRPREMYHFYEEQLRRIEQFSEPVRFEDLLCQLHDMLQPAMEGAYTVRDLKRMRPQAGILFNALFNVRKFLNFEHRDPFAQQRNEASEFAGMTEWDKFAKLEYLRLANEDDQGEPDTPAGESGVWDGLDQTMLDPVR